VLFCEQSVDSYEQSDIVSVAPEAFCHLLGSKLVGKTKDKGKLMDTRYVLAGKEVIGLYFSSNSSMPCRQFSPLLVEVYDACKRSGKSFEVVYISSDSDESSFKNCHNTHPWLALPYKEHDIKKALRKNYGIPGIPSLVLLDGSTGEIITINGRELLAMDSIGANFPWRSTVPLPSLWEVLGAHVVRNGPYMEEGAQEPLSYLRGEGKVIGIYFAASWCAACRAFTPKLVKTYNAVKAAGKKFEIIFVSSDTSREDFNQYLLTMPWTAIPLGEKRAGDLAKRFHVTGVPLLVLLDGDSGALINRDGRKAIIADPKGARFPWQLA